MKKDEFKETFSEIPGIYELPKNISDFFEQNKGVAEKFFWQANLLQTFEKICIFLAKVSLSEYKNSPFAKNQTSSKEIQHINLRKVSITQKYSPEQKSCHLENISKNSSLQFGFCPAKQSTFL